MSLQDLVAAIGENNTFVAFQAHMWFAEFVVQHTGASIPVALACALAAGIKEFWFDATYERNPPQTFTDNLTDFLGYASGIALALLLAHI